MIYLLPSLSILFSIMNASSIIDSFRGTNDLLKTSCSNKDNTEIELQFDGTGNYCLYKNFYCSSGVQCPQTFAPILATMDDFSIENIKCEGSGLALSFDLKLTETVNSLNRKVDLVNQSAYTYGVSSSIVKSFKSLSFSHGTESKPILKSNDKCAANKSHDQCQTTTHTQNTKCYSNKCKFVKNINP
ncbi:hypothetical protein K502DRAFT_352519 [Neoconidiobolus thromboides FSU 785]|nr:hypothetical protein K502DRAFT_352519 [Neoconidiobolus thromboides FSU 785]